jgi:hypothetical protein
MSVRFCLLCLSFFGGLSAVKAQNFHALQGSSYTGAIGVHNNPASIVNTPFPWDVALFGFQVKSSTNAFRIYNYSLLSSPANSQYGITKGDFARFADLNFSMPVLNARIALSRTKSIAFGANIRGYTNLNTSAFNYVDTLKGISQFFKLNNPNNSVSAKLNSSNWIELFATYAQTIFDNNSNRLNVGITLKASRGFTGSYLRLANSGFTSSVVNNKTTYALKSTSASYIYSRNFDGWNSSAGFGQNIRNFVTYTEGGISADVGAEWLIKGQEVATFGDEDSYFDYDWKIGASLLDMGFNRYRPGQYAAATSVGDGVATSTLLDQKFSKINSIRQVNDSLKTFTNFQQNGTEYMMINPMRFVLNVDHYLSGDFYVNGEMSINLSPLAGTKRLYVREINFLTLTPRWERKNLGFYMPMQFNNNSQFWVGGAVKAGPLVIGLHNLSSLFSKTKVQNGGGYLAIIIHPYKSMAVKGDKRLDCPKEK